MSPTQKMILITFSLALITCVIDAHLPAFDDRFAVNIGIASVIVLIGMFVLRPPEDPNAH